jgi:hypothetical protein
MDYSVTPHAVRLKRLVLDRCDQNRPGERTGLHREAEESRSHVPPSGFVAVPEGPCRAGFGRDLRPAL